MTKTNAGSPHLYRRAINTQQIFSKLIDILLIPKLRCRNVKINNNLDFVKLKLRSVPAGKFEVYSEKAGETCLTACFLYYIR